MELMWEKFEKKHYKNVEATFTINQKHRLYMNKTFTTKYNPLKYEYAHLYSSKKDDDINLAIKFKKSKDRGDLKVCMHKGGGNSISLKSFLSKNKVRGPMVIRSYEVKESEIENKTVPYLIIPFVDHES